MAFFEDLGKMITQTSQDVVQKTKDTAGVVKLNGMISDEKKRVNDLYIQIGKKYFEMYSDSCDQEFEPLVAEIKDAQAKIDDYSEQVRQLKGIAACPNCGAEVPTGTAFCSKCGAKMEQPKAEAKDEAKDEAKVIYVTTVVEGNFSNILSIFMESEKGEESRDGYRYLETMRL